MTDGFIVPCFNETLANDSKKKKEAIKEKKGYRQNRPSRQDQRISPKADSIR
jgi:hypothetical protein